MARLPKLHEYLNGAREPVTIEGWEIPLALRLEIAVEEWQEDVITFLEDMVRNWEEIEPESGSLYSLGLRRAIDVINGTYVDPLEPREKVPDTSSD